MKIEFERKNIAILITLICIVAISFWFIFTSKSIKFAKYSSLSPDSYMMDLKVTQVNKSGQLENTFFATKALNYTQQNKTTFDAPFIIHNVPNAPPWHITAKHGQALENGNTIILTDHVKAQQLPGPNSHNITLTTSKLTYYPKKALAITHQPVVIEQPGSIIHSKGLRADLNKNVIKLISNVHGQYGKTSSTKLLP
ncbi:MAG: LPS export ABC transporter periplasmic protein LptC [Gammaproteobacteria bacterium]|jgi:lipopolysaccharide export system protein LptC